MRIMRHFLGKNGVVQQDFGTTPDSEILTEGYIELQDDDGVGITSNKPYKLACFDLMASWVVGPKVLEIGIGLGLLSERIRARGIIHDRNDISNDVFTIAAASMSKRNFTVGKKYLGNYRTMLSNIPNNTYDTILIDMVGQGYDFMDQRSDLTGNAEIKRLLKPNGLYIPLSSNQEPQNNDYPGFRLVEKKQATAYWGHTDFDGWLEEVLRIQGKTKTPEQKAKLKARHIAQHSCKRWVGKYKKKAIIGIGGINP